MAQQETPTVIVTGASSGVGLYATKALVEGVSKTWGATPRVGLLGGRSVRPAPQP